MHLDRRRRVPDCQVAREKCGISWDSTSSILRSNFAFLLDQCGFRKVAMKKYPYVLSMASVANSIGRYPLASKFFGGIFKSRALSSAKVTFALPGEMFAIYSKVLSVRDERVDEVPRCG